jgi:hypothetical protein
MNKQITQNGAEIRIPRRGGFFDDINRAATPEKKSKRRAPKKR